MFDILVQTGKHGGEIRQAGKQVSKIIAHDAYAPGGRVYLMKYWIPAAFVVAALNGVAEYYLPRMSPSLAQIVLGTVVVLVFAFLLFLLKQEQQMMYGSVALAFAIWSSSFSLSRMNNTLTAPVVVGLFTSIYLTIRAADNITRGYEQWKARKRSVLATLERLSDLEEVKKYRVWFAATVRATGELFIVQTQFSNNDKPLIYSKPPVNRNAKYMGILFAAGDADKLWSVKDPNVELGTFFGHELKIVDGSAALLRNADPLKQIDTAPHGLQTEPSQ
jgi:hypothetical protein